MTYFIAGGNLNFKRLTMFTYLLKSRNLPYASQSK